MALLHKFELPWLALNNAYFKIDRIAVAPGDKIAEIQWSIYASEEARKELKVWPISSFQIIFQNKNGTPKNSAFLEDGTLKPNMTDEDWEVKPELAYARFMSASGENIIERAYNALKWEEAFAWAQDN